jgi:hypothetical protein
MDIDTLSTIIDKYSISTAASLWVLLVTIIIINAKRGTL